MHFWRVSEVDFCCA